MAPEGEKLNYQTHEYATKAGFVFKKGRYFALSEPQWEKEKRIEKGRRQYAVPASSVEQFLKDEEAMVDRILKKCREKAGVSADAVADDDEEEEPPKKKKKKKVEEDDDE
eukprot:TRINITY_DN189_c1_g1_i1.p2 TRINITY_DN189_c1_g1~~TRINITY_DN189_c1_g1_i1.p2  ORF type:complete len:110 (+),score=53.87 TRINITY_DN189_c1_g1_i1:73-402(+)